MNQTVLEEPAQSCLLMGQPSQAPMTFPQTLAERYQPQTLNDFVGLDRPKRFFSSLIERPRPCSLLLVGAPGTGKTVAGMALGNAIGSLVHVSAQKCDVASLDALAERFAYSPPTGDFWIPVVDEADQMTEKAQLQLLSRMDGTAALTPTFGGGFKRGTPPPVIWVFTCNGKGEDGTRVPPSLASRFVSRCMKVEFVPPTADEMVEYMQGLWEAEGGPAVEPGYFAYLCRGVGLRDALMRMDTDLLAGPRPVIVEPPPEVRAAREPSSAGVLVDFQSAAREALGPQAVVWQSGGRFRCGVYTETDGRWVEEGKLIVGTGSSAAGAIRDARRRHAA